ncbi:hypothetical protein L3X38_009336 [Prunus dulcis]|uniref:Uncharacterized protein n=1 Tax=Prunus dulcis TaxID=3755 RepID=A0AAD4ZYH2_PRUDU|nr:hypothetical protein L3X38_009336 [Prunus dulcis]
MSPSLIPQRVKSRAEHASMLGLYLLKSKNCCTTTDYFSSYIPEPGDHSHAPMSDQLKPRSPDTAIPSQHDKTVGISNSPPNFGTS